MALLESPVGCGPQCAGWLVRCLARVDDLYDSTRDRPRGQKGRHEYTAEWAHQPLELRSCNIDTFTTSSLRGGHVKCMLGHKLSPTEGV